VTEYCEIKKFNKNLYLKRFLSIQNVKEFIYILLSAL